MLVGGMLMVVCSGVIMAATLLSEGVWASVARLAAPWGFLAGAVIYAVMQRGVARSVARGADVPRSVTLRRLFTLQLLSAICFVLAGVVMVEQFWHFMQPLFVKDINSYFTYLRVVHNNWVILLLIGAVIQMYTTHRIAAEQNRQS